MAEESKDNHDIITELYQRFKEKKRTLNDMKEKLKNANLSLQGIAPLLEPKTYQNLLLSLQGMNMEMENLEYQIDESDDLHLDEGRTWLRISENIGVAH